MKQLIQFRLAASFAGFHLWFRRKLLVSAPFITAALVSGKDLTDSNAPIELGNERVRVEAQVLKGHLRERYLARRGNDWILVAANEEGGTVGPTAVIATDPAVE